MFFNVFFHEKMIICLDKRSIVSKNIIDQSFVDFLVDASSLTKSHFSSLPNKLNNKLGLVCLLFFFNGLSTYMGYLIPKPS